MLTGTGCTIRLSRVRLNIGDSTDSANVKYSAPNVAHFAEKIRFSERRTVPSSTEVMDTVTVDTLPPVLKAAEGIDNRPSTLAESAAIAMVVASPTVTEYDAVVALI